MNLSLMSFSMYRDYPKHGFDATGLLQIAAQNDISQLDLLSFEVDLLGEAALKTALDAADARLNCYITGASFYEAPDKVEAELTAALERTKRLGGNRLMVVPGSNTAAEEALCAAMTRQQMLDRAVECFALAVELGRRYGIAVCFENTPHACKPLAAPQDCLYVLQHVPGLGLVFDTGNFRVADTACDELAAYELLQQYIVHVHLKDVVVGNFAVGERCMDGQHIRPVVTGSGIIPMEELLHALQRDGYQGSLAVEYSAPVGVHGEEHVQILAAYCRFIRAALAGEVRRAPCAEILGIAISVSRIFFGTAIFPILTGANADALFDSMYACGINAFDCARGYGYAEKSLGQWMQNRNNRSRVVILTKCGNVNADGKPCVSRQIIQTELAQSLAALQTDYIDLYLLHRDDPTTPVSEIIDTLNEAQQAGKIRVFGASNWTHTRIREANAYAAANGLHGFAVSSPNFGLAEQVCDPWGGACITISGAENADARSWYAAQQMPIMAYSSLGRGFFSGKFRSGDYEAAKQVLDAPAQKGYLHPCNMERLRRAEQLAQRDGCTVAQVAMRYVFGSSMNVFAVISTTSVARMMQNVTATLTPLCPVDICYLESVQNG